MSRSRHISFSFSGPLTVSATLAAFVACAGSDVPVDNSTGSGGTQVAAVGGSGGSAGSASGGNGGSGVSGMGGGNMGGSASGMGGSGSAVTCNGGALVVSKCGMAGCHGAGSGFSAFAASEAAPADFVDTTAMLFPNCGAIIDSADPAESLLLKKINGNEAGCGGKMPATGSVTADDVSCIETWLADEFGG